MKHLKITVAFYNAQLTYTSLNNMLGHFHLLLDSDEKD